MNRSSLDQLYKIRRGIVYQHGRFYGQPAYTPYFWGRLIEEGPIRTYRVGGRTYNILYVDFAARSLFKDCKNAVTVLIFEDEHGAVFSILDPNETAILSESERKYEGLPEAS